MATKDRVKSAINESRSQSRRINRKTQNKFEAFEARKRAETIPVVHTIAAEFAVGYMIAVIALFFRPPDSDRPRSTEFVLRVTGLSAIFFILSLAANSPKMAAPVKYIGFFIDLAMLLNVTATSMGSKKASKK